MWYVSESDLLSGGPEYGSAPLALWWSYIVVSALREETVSPVDAYAAGSETPRSPGQTVRSRLAPSVRIVSPTPTTPVLDHSASGAGQVRPWVGAIVLVCTV